MDRTAFEGLAVLRQEHGARVGDAEVCRRRDGTALVRLRVRDNACQRACLAGRIPAYVRLERGVLEILYPLETGVSLKEWLFNQERTLGARRDACLELLAQCVADRPPPCVLALSALEENLRFSSKGLRLAYLPNWGRWRRETREGDAVAAVAAVCEQVVTRGLSLGPNAPVELRLFRRRVAEGGYTRWGSLQRDLSALPDALPTWEEAGKGILRGVWGKIARLSKPLFCAITAVALVLAICSLGAAAVRGQRERAVRWPGMTEAAGQKWGEGP